MREPPVSIGIVGAGRTRQGLGPFLARWFERHGAVVAGISGRSVERTGQAAAELGAQLGHEVRVFDDAASLAASVDALVVACPVEGHLDGLDAALAAGVPCLCEKPLVDARDRDAGLSRVAAFEQRGLLLTENCQWPFALDAVEQLEPSLLQRPARRVAMRLSPAWPGGAMVADSLSHVLSLVQATRPLSPDAHVVDVTQSDGAADATANVVRFRIVDGSDDVHVELDLQCCPQQPRPAWFALDGRRFDRRIGAGYEISFEADDGRVANVRDPLDRLVYGFVANLEANRRERTDAIQLRIRLYAGVLEQLG